MIAKNTILIIVAVLAPIATSLANPVNDGPEPAQISDRDLEIAYLLHRIYEHSIEAEVVEERVEKNGGKRSPHDDPSVAYIKTAIKALESLADVKVLRVKLSQDLEEIQKSQLKLKHPRGRWLELLSRSFEKYGEPIK